MKNQSHARDKIFLHGKPSLCCDKKPLGLKTSNQQSTIWKSNVQNYLIDATLKLTFYNLWYNLCLQCNATPYVLQQILSQLLREYSFLPNSIWVKHKE